MIMEDKASSFKLEDCTWNVEGWCTKQGEGKEEVSGDRRRAATEDDDGEMEDRPFKESNSWEEIDKQR